MLTRRQVEVTLKARELFGQRDSFERELIATLEAAVAAARHFEWCDYPQQERTLAAHFGIIPCSECTKHREFLRQFEGNT